MPARLNFPGELEVLNGGIRAGRVRDPAGDLEIAGVEPALERARGERERDQGGRRGEGGVGRHAPERTGPL
jgi:hypothetical protein